MSSEVEGEVGVSSSAGTADSPDLYVKSGGSDDPSNNDPASPDLSPPSSSPPHTPPRPAQRGKSARFLRQTAVDHGDRGRAGGEEREEKGGGGGVGGGQTEIQVQMEGGRGGGEGGKGEYLHTNSWSEDKRRGTSSRGGVSGHHDDGNSRGGGQRTNGHKHSSSNHKSQEHGSSNHRGARGDRCAESSSSAPWTSGRIHGDRGMPNRAMHGRSGRLLEQDEEKLSNYEMEMKPLQPRDSNTHKPHGHGEERHGHSHGEGRSHTLQRQSHRNREGKDGREGKEGSKDSAPKPDSARQGEKLESRPLRRDLTLSSTQKSSAIALEHQDKSLTQSKGNSVRLYLLTLTNTTLKAKSVIQM